MTLADGAGGCSSAEERPRWQDALRAHRMARAGLMPLFPSPTFARGLLGSSGYGEICAGATSSAPSGKRGHLGHGRSPPLARNVSAAAADDGRGWTARNAGAPGDWGSQQARSTLLLRGVRRVVLRTCRSLYDLSDPGVSRAPGGSLPIARDPLRPPP